MKRLTAACIALIVLSALGGCATTNFDENPHRVRTAVSIATTVYVRSADNVDKQVRRAERIAAIASDARAIASGEAVTLETLSVAVRAKMAALGLPAIDQLAADEFVQGLASELRAQIGDGLLDPEKLARLDMVLSWVEETAKRARAAIEAEKLAWLRLEYEHVAWFSVRRVLYALAAGGGVH